MLKKSYDDCGIRYCLSYVAFMKWHVVLILICIVIFAQLVFAQQGLPELVRKFDDVGCELFLALHDGFMAELQRNPESMGYVVIYGPAKDLQTKLTYESWALGNINFRGFEKSRMKVVRAEIRPAFKIEFWSVPPGAIRPFSEVEWSFVLPESTKPFIFHDSESSEGSCPTGQMVIFFADLLTANPTAQGNIVIRSLTRKAFDMQRREITTELVTRNKIQRNRLRFFFVRDRKTLCAISACAEFWAVPQHKSANNSAKISHNS